MVNRVFFRLFLFFCIVGGAFQATISIGQEPDESKFLHILIVGDTVDSGVGKSVEKDITELKSLFENGISESKRSVTILADDFLTQDSLFDAIDRLKVDVDDSLLLYYCGHGVVDEEDNHYFALPTGKVLRSEVRKAVQKKNPRLCVLLSDCCAILEPPIRVYMAPHFKTVNSELIRYLFFRSQGLVDINSARSGEVAFCSDVSGGFFTERFSRLFDLPTSDLIHVDSNVPTWSTALEKITELLIPSKMEIDSQQVMDDPRFRDELQKIEQTRGIRFFRDKKTPNRPIQHPVAFSALPAASAPPFPTGENTLGFTYRVIPDEEILIETVVPGSMAMWSGLEKGDAILGFEQQLFDMKNAPEVPLPPGLDVKPRAVRLGPDFDFDTFLLSNMPIGTHMPNTTPGWIKAVVRKSSDNRIENIPVVTSMPPIKKDWAKLTPEEVKEVWRPYFLRLAPRKEH